MTLLGYPSDMYRGVSLLIFGTFLIMGGGIYAEVTGHPVPSFYPWPEPNEKGGGVVLPYKYILTNIDVNNLLNKLKELFSKLEEGAEVELYCTNHD